MSEDLGLLPEAEQERLRTDKQKPATPEEDDETGNIEP
jgi:hypothetical protein